MMLRDIRKNYSRQELHEESLLSNPIEQFRIWLSDAINAQLNEPTAMVLSTIKENNTPDSRVVLLKELTGSGFIFYTNIESDKGQQILSNPNVSINFFWSELERQVRILGIASQLDDDIANEYFQSRPRESQIGACASRQSRKITSRKEIESRFYSLQQRYKNKTIPKPLYWGGYIVEPVSIEFWQGRKNRLHDRIKYELVKNDWLMFRLSP